MYKIINGKRYGTETGVFIANWSNGLNGDDPERVFEALYKKRDGTYFLYGVGGALSRFPKENILPLTYEEARAWAERYIDTDTYEREFSGADTKPVNITIRAPKSVINDFKRLTAEKGMTTGELLAELIKSYK